MTRALWVLGHFIASLGCRLNGGHPPHMGVDLTLLYCQHCGHLRGHSFRVAAPAPEPEAQEGAWR